MVTSANLDVEQRGRNLLCRGYFDSLGQVAGRPNHGVPGFEDDCFNLAGYDPTVLDEEGMSARCSLIYDCPFSASSRPPENGGSAPVVRQ